MLTRTVVFSRMRWLTVIQRYIQAKQMICRKLKIYVLEHGSSVEPWLLCLRCGMLIRFEELYKLLLFSILFLLIRACSIRTMTKEQKLSRRNSVKFINGYSTVPCIYRKTNILSVRVNWTVTLFSSGIRVKRLAQEVFNSYRKFEGSVRKQLMYH